MESRVRHVSSGTLRSAANFFRGALPLSVVSRRRIAVLFLCCSLLLAGCTSPVWPPTASGKPNGSFAGGDNGPPDPPHDRIGWEDGYWYNQSLDVNQSNGLNASERHALVARTEARVEKIRGLEFKQDVSVKVMSREQYRKQSVFGGKGNKAYNEWRDQVYESLLLVGENQNTSDVFGRLYGGSVAGYYSPGQNSIVIVSDSKTPKLDTRTLAHELTHALQDQYFHTGGSKTLDGKRARQGLTEGDPNLVEDLYQKRCQNGTWQCVPQPAASSSGSRKEKPSDFGVFLTLYLPYSDGPTLVDRVYKHGGWRAVNAMYENPPSSTEQVIHPAKYPDDKPVNVTVTDRTSGSWSRFNVHPSGDTVGEGALFAMLYQNGYVSKSQLGNTDRPFETYNYSNPATAGWAGDRVVPYHNGNGQYGYVLRTAWDTRKDAKQFESAYLNVLTKHLDGKRVDGAGGPGTVVRIPDGKPFGDAYRVYRTGKTITVVDAPTVEQLNDVHRPE